MFDSYFGIPYASAALLIARPRRSLYVREPRATRTLPRAVEMNREEDRHKEPAVNDVGPWWNILEIGQVAQDIDTAHPPKLAVISPHNDHYARNIALCRLDLPRAAQITARGTASKSK